MILEPNTDSRSMVEKLGFSQWGFLPASPISPGRSAATSPAACGLPGRVRGSASAVYLSGVILVIFDPCRPIPAISPFWPNTKA